MGRWRGDFRDTRESFCSGLKGLATVMEKQNDSRGWTAESPHTSTGISGARKEQRGVGAASVCRLPFSPRRHTDCSQFWSCPGASSNNSLNRAGEGRCPDASSQQPTPWDSRVEMSCRGWGTAETTHQCPLCWGCWEMPGEGLYGGEWSPHRPGRLGGSHGKRLKR